MSQNSAVLLGLAACLVGVATFALVHRRDALGGLAAMVMLFTAAAVALVGFSASADPAGAAQLQAFAVLVELLALLFVGVGAALAVVLWRRTGADLLSLVVAWSPPSEGATASAGEAGEESGPGGGDDADGEAEPAPGADPDSVAAAGPAPAEEA